MNFISYLFIFIYVYFIYLLLFFLYIFFTNAGNVEKFSSCSLHSDRKICNDFADFHWKFAMILQWNLAYSHLRDWRTSRHHGISRAVRSPLIGGGGARLGPPFVEVRFSSLHIGLQFDLRANLNWEFSERLGTAVCLSASWRHNWEPLEISQTSRHHGISRAVSSLHIGLHSNLRANLNWEFLSDFVE